MAGWPEEGKDSDLFRSMQREAEEIKGDLASDQPTDMQLLNAREEVNTARRRVMKSEFCLEAAKERQEKIMKELTIAKDEVAA
eukprot:14059649-Heterocapsa_arctica.AAC.1